MKQGRPGKQAFSNSSGKKPWSKSQPWPARHTDGLKVLNTAKKHRLASKVLKATPAAPKQLSAHKS